MTHGIEKEKDMTFHKWLILFLIFSSAGCVTIKADWEKAQKIDTANGYEEFLKNHPKSEFEENARTSLITKRWEETQSIDTISAYKRFLDKYPDNEYAAIIKARIAEISRQQEKAERLRQEAMERAHRKAMDKLTSYVPNVTTEDQFFADGWNAKDPYIGKIGILRFIGQEKSLEVILGLVEGTSEKPNTEAGKQIQDIFAFTKDAYSAEISSVFQPNYLSGRSDCIFKFENRLLKSVSSNCRSVESLILALKDGDTDVRKKAIEALGESKDSRAIEPLIAVLKDEKDTEVRTNAASILGELKDSRAVESLIITLKDNDPNVRRTAVTALGEIKDSRAVESLILALKDGHADVRSRATEVLGKLNDSRAVGPLIIALKDRDSRVRWNSAQALEK